MCLLEKIWFTEVGVEGQERIFDKRGVMNVEVDVLFDVEEE